MNIVNNKSLLLDSLKKFYQKSEHYLVFLQLTNSNSKYSLRLLDYICTKYSKLFAVILEIKKNKHINLHSSYKDQLKAYSKVQFDPFRRHDRITVIINNTPIETTVAQLNFFKWVIEIKLTDWLKTNVQNVEKHMKTNSSNKNKKNKKIK